MKPHKHAEIIKAWADGAEIQMKSKIDGRWWDCNDPEWDGDYEYRIKPEEKKPVVRWLWACKVSGDWVSHGRLLTESEAAHTFTVFAYKRLEWSLTEFEE